MRLRWSVGAATILVGLMVLTAGPVAASGPRTLVVDDDGAQCPGAGYTAIQPAIDAANPGDTVRVCGGNYASDLIKIDDNHDGINLVAQVPAAPAIDCLADSVTYPAALAVVNNEIRVAAGDVHVDGLVVIAPVTADAGIFLTDSASGYRVSRNVVDNTEFGIEVESSGAHQTVVERNCVRDARFVGIASQDGALRNAVIRQNTTVGNMFGIAAELPQPRSDISITRNTSRRDQTAIAVSGTVGSDITGNSIDLTGAAGVPAPGMIIGSGNVGLAITGNTVTGGKVNGGPITFARGYFGDTNLASNVGLFITGNTVHDVYGPGISTGVQQPGEPGNVTRSLFLRNTLQNNVLASGLFLGPGNDGNVLLANTSTGNLRGINLLGATGTLVIGNTLLGNTLVDARDIDSSHNTWIANRCVTDDPHGALCTAPTGAATTMAARGSTTKATPLVPTRPNVDQSRWPCLRVPVWDVDPVDGGAWVWITVVAPDAPAGTYCGT